MKQLTRKWTQSNGLLNQPSYRVLQVVDRLPNIACAIILPVTFRSEFSAERSIDEKYLSDIGLAGANQNLQLAVKCGVSNRKRRLSPEIERNAPENFLAKNNLSFGIRGLAHEMYERMYVCIGGILRLC